MLSPCLMRAHACPLSAVQVLSRGLRETASHSSLLWSLAYKIDVHKKCELSRMHRTCELF